MIEYSNLNETFITFIIKRFPELKEQVEGEMSRLGEFLPHVIWEMYEDLSSNGLKEMVANNMSKIGDYFASQCGNPRGVIGKIMTWAMNRANHVMYKGIVDELKILIIQKSRCLSPELIYI